MKWIDEFYKKVSFGFSKQLFYAYISVLIIALLLFSGIIYFGTASMLKSRLIASSTETIEQAAINMRQYINDVETLMFNISVDPSVQSFLSDRKEKNDYTAVKEVQEIVNQMLIVDVFSKKTGGVYLFADFQDKYPVYRPTYLRPEAGYSGKSAVFRAEEVRVEKWYRDAIAARGQVVWTTPREDSVHGGTMFSASRLILNTKNTKEPLGVVRVFVPLSRFQSTLEDISFGADGVTYLYSGGALLNSQDEEESQKIIKIADRLGESATRQKLASGYCYVIINDTGISDWKLIGVIPERTMLSQFNFMKRVMIPSLLVVFVLTLLLIRTVSRYLSKPIHEVALAMQSYDINQSKRFIEDRSGEIGMLFNSFNRMMNHIDFLLKEIQETSTRQRRAELQALQAQINPHFLYNTLDCIKSIACLKENQEIVELTTAFCEFFRISLNRGAEETTLRNEILHVQNYCAIQKFRSSAAFELKTGIPEQLLDRRVIKLILQPLIENAIIHGFAGLDKKGIITVTAKEEADFLVISVSDNGSGADTEYLNGVLSGEYTVTDKGTMHSGYGIVNVDERLKLAFGPKSGLLYMENADGEGITAEIRMAQKSDAVGDVK